MKEKYLYIMISGTPTRFGRAIRKIGKVTYNHAAISLDRDLDNIYSFARKKHKALLTGKLVKESISRYTLNRTDTVNVVIFKIPVTNEQYAKVEEIIFDIQNDKEYIYNLFSVLTYPFTKGLSVYKAFSCIEFVMYVMQKIGFEISNRICSYKPDDLLNILSEYVHFQGNLLDYRNPDNDGADYFTPLTMEDIKESIVALARVFFRLFINKNATS